MNMLSVALPALKLLFERIGRPTVHNLPDLLRPGGGGAVIVCNHHGWADGLWMSYAVYPRSLRHMSKRELFASSFARWALEQGGSIPIDRATPSPSSIKVAVELLRQGELLLVFPAGTRRENTLFKRGAATIALHAHAPIVPVLYEGPTEMQLRHLLGRPTINVTFGSVVSTVGMPANRETASALTERLQASIEALRPTPNAQPHAA